MPIVLPPSLDREIQTLEKECAYAKSLTPEERLEVVAQCCAAAWSQVLAHTQRDRLLAMEDPLPESTIAALKRLRRTG
ncbi:MAG: hypothetical protein R3F61_36830 [Myxococcota bacterium]